MPRKKNPTSSIPVLGASQIAGDFAAVEIPPDIAAEMAALRARNAELEAAAATKDMGDSSVGAPLIREVEKARNAGTVSVACKVEMGIRLQLQHKQRTKVPSGRGGEYVVDEISVFGGKSYYVFGPAVPAQTPQGYILPPMIEGGYAITHGIPADFWAQWLEQNQMADYVVNRMIFAMDKQSTKAAAREMDELKSGMQPLSQDVDKNGRLKDKRVIKPVNPNVGRIAIDSDRMAERSGQTADAD